MKLALSFARNTALTFAAVIALVASASAGGTRVLVSESHRHGADALLVTVTECGAPGHVTVQAVAEGRIGDRRVSKTLTVESTAKSGVFRVRPEWPGEGTWLVRITSTGAHSMTALARVRAPRPGTRLLDKVQYMYGAAEERDVLAVLASRS